MRTAAVVNWFLDLGDRDGIAITPMKLQRLLYYAFGWYFAVENQPLFGDRIAFGPHGPVVEDVYHMFKGFGNNPIRGVRAQAVVYAEDHWGFETPEIPQVADVIRRVLAKVWDEYKTLSAVQLSNMAHGKGTPWDRANVQRNWYRGVEQPNWVLSDAEIREYFRSLSAKATR